MTILRDLSVLSLSENRTASRRDRAKDVIRLRKWNDNPTLNVSNRLLEITIGYSVEKRPHQP